MDGVLEIGKCEMSVWTEEHGLVDTVQDQCAVTYEGNNDVDLFLAEGNRIYYDHKDSEHIVTYVNGQEWSTVSELVPGWWLSANLVPDQWTIYWDKMFDNPAYTSFGVSCAPSELYCSFEISEGDVDGSICNCPCGLDSACQHPQDRYVESWVCEGPWIATSTVSKPLSCVMSEDFWGNGPPVDTDELEPPPDLPGDGGDDEVGD